MGSKIEYVEPAHMYATNYVRNAKAIGVLWAIFTICYAIIDVVIFITPEWLGDLDTENPGRLGIWQFCKLEENGEVCKGKLEDFLSIPGFIFQIVTVLVGFSVVVSLFTICTMLLFFFCKSTTVFHICGWLQMLSAITLGVGVAIYPMGWDTPAVRETCGQEATQYGLGDCNIRWAYHLAILATLDALTLSALSFILATRHISLQPDYHPSIHTLYKGEVNNAYVTDGMSISGSRKSLALQPVLLMHPHHGGSIHHSQQHLDSDNYSQFSNRTGRSKHSAYRGDYANTLHNFQL